MFIGEYSHSVDPKGRIAIPAKFRTGLTKGAVVTKGLDGCLFVYPAQEWEELAQKLKGLPITQGDARAFVRFMFAGAAEVDIDKQGRINLPRYLLEYAKIVKQAKIAGLFNRIEIWSEDAWDKFRQKAENESSVIAEHLADLGI